MRERRKGKKGTETGISEGKKRRGKEREGKGRVKKG